MYPVYTVFMKVKTKESLNLENPTLNTVNKNAYKTEDPCPYLFVAMANLGQTFL